MPNPQGIVDSFIQPPPNQGGPSVDTSQGTTDAGTVQRQRITPGDADDFTTQGLAAVKSQVLQAEGPGTKELLGKILARLDDIFELLADKV